MKKLSRYAHFFLGDGELPPHFLFHALTGGLYTLSDEARSQFEELRDHPDCGRHEEMLDYWVSQRVFIEHDCDEIKILKERFRTARNSKEELYATFVMTESCNFRCVYCYQPHDRVHAQRDALTKAIRHLEAKMPEYERLKVHWFGGEPLLMFDNIVWASQQLQHLADKHGVAFSAGVTTNGSLLTTERAMKLKELGVTQLQFTVDGDEADHNQLRVLSSGKGTFEIVLRAIKTGLDAGLHVFVRVNISPVNVQGFPQLLDRLLHEGIAPTDVILYLNEMKQHGCSSSDESLYFSSVAEYGSYLVKALGEMAKRGFPLPAIRPTDVNCAFDKPSTLLFSTDGNLHHCTTGTDRPLAILNENGKVCSTTERMQHVHSREPWDDPICEACSYLPLCMGGCAYLEEDGKTKCNPERFTLEPLVKLIGSRN